MAGKLTDTSGLKGSVRGIWRRLTGRSKARRLYGMALESSQPLVKEKEKVMEEPREFLDRMQAELKRTGNTPPETLSRFLAIMKQKLLEEGDPVALKKAQLCELILPEVVGKVVGGNFQVDHEAAKTWAFACGELLGMLAGLSIKERALDGAIDEVAAEAKLVARGLQKAIHTGGAVSAPETSTSAIERMKADSVAQSLQMVKDMLAQAEAETDPAAASALRAMAESIKASIPRAA